MVQYLYTICNCTFPKYAHYTQERTTLKYDNKLINYVFQCVLILSFTKILQLKNSTKKVVYV